MSRWSDALVAIDPEAHNSHFYHFRVQRRLGDLDAAERSLLLAIELCPSPHYKSALAQLLRDTGREKQALDIQRRLVAGNPGFTHARVELIRHLIRDGFSQEARDHVTVVTSESIDANLRQVIDGLAEEIAGALPESQAGSVCESGLELPGSERSEIGSDDEPWRPSPTPDLEVEPDGDLTLVTRPGLDRFSLNRSAGAVFGLCDGTRTVEQIGEALSCNFQINRSSLRRDLTETLDHLVELGLIVPAAPTLPEHPPCR